MKNKDTSFSSLWLFDKKDIKGYRDNLANTNIKMGRGENYSQFNPILAGKIIRFWSEKGDTILDPFAGRTRAIVATLEGRKYVGFEISPKVCKSLQKSLSQTTLNGSLSKDIRLIMDDSFNIKDYDVGEVDMIFTCPPYWNLERYESTPGQLSDYKDYADFLGRFSEIMAKAVSHLKEEGFCALVVGDWRRDNRYYTFHKSCMTILEGLGLTLWDFIINQATTFDVACVRFGQFRERRYTAKVHEFVLIYKKVKNDSPK